MTESERDGLFRNWLREHQGIMIKIARARAAASLFMAVFMLIDHLRQNGKSTLCSQTLATWVEKSRSDIEHQVWPLRNVFWWYLLPPLIGMATVFAHHVWLVRGTGPAHFLALGVSFLLFAIAGIILYGVYVLNQRAVRKELWPRLEELQKLAESLSHDQGET